MERSSNLIFSHGRFQCLGKFLALTELNIVLVELFRRFEFAVVCPQKPWRIKAFDIFMQEEFWLRVLRRE
jgi:cytochrome P450